MTEPDTRQKDIVIACEESAKTPDYLNEVYWWAYVHPKAVKLFERQWLVNIILWGNFKKLRNEALHALTTSTSSVLEGATLQVACVYGDFTPKLFDCMADSATLDIVDVLPQQLHNTQEKLPNDESVRYFQSNSASLNFSGNGCYDQVVLFFLLHEQPASTRIQTIKEAVRVLKRGGKLVVVDYHKPSGLHPLKWLMYPVLKWLEPFALDLWRHDVQDWLPEDGEFEVSKATYFAGLYQRLIIKKVS